jgi:flagellar biosynthesis chaperone FliJ
MSFERALEEAVKTVWSEDTIFAENLERARNTYAPIQHRRKALRQLMELDRRKSEVGVAIKEMQIQWLKEAIECAKNKESLLKELRETQHNAYAQRENIVYNLGWVDCQIDLCDRNAGSTSADAVQELQEHQARIILASELQTISEQVGDTEAFEELTAQLAMLTTSLADVQRTYDATMKMVRFKEAKKQ